ncbi:MAG: cytochrome C [Flavobacteriales bacterium CG18_big_fil_WC_8_21_14_2_50_32_9]|nr:MAG: cytochrome C [Flavobacteriales bacterium CG18_big_fil_WC_8_21_14_2_50_32_9]PJC62337.1 MAG: cytochrome C [Flavobacteriales bacterium CG_4_9_14_0_2_um_filter_32_27]
MKKYLNNSIKITVVAAVISFSSCKEKNGLAPEYMPDMYRSPSLETYVDYGELRGKRGNDSLRNVLNARKPVAGTIHRGFSPYPYANSIDGYNEAGEKLTSAIPYTEQSVAKGKELYGMFCVHCHGTTGQGDGTLVEREVFPPLPIKFNENIVLSEGKMFHSITFGKNLMGAHASQLNQEERWQLIHFIRVEFMKQALTANIVSTADTNVVAK